MILEGRGLTKSFGGIKAVNNVDIQIKKGELSSIIGPNGAGKTTLFNLLTGHLQADSGRIIFEGRDITNLSPYQISRLGVGRSFQRVNVFPMLTVFENIQLALLSGQGKGKEIFSQAKDMFIDETDDILEIVGLKKEANILAGHLAHGDQRRLEIGIALGGRPTLLLLDEPTAGMSPEETKSTTNFIQRVAKEQKLTVIFTEHDMSVVFHISEKIRVMNQGNIITIGGPEEIRANKEVQQIYLTDVDVPKYISIPKIQLKNKGELPKEKGPVFLEVKDIDTFYGLSHILFKVFLRVHKGEVVCLLGRNGVGKTTTFKSIVGLSPPISGSIKFDGEEIIGKPPYQIARRGIGFVPEGRIIFPDLTVRENLEIVMKRGRKDGNWTLEKIFALFRILKDREKQKGGTLSGGEQQMLTIARTLMGNPQLLLLDEPSEGLAPRILTLLYEQIGLLKKEGMPILLAEQNSSFALMLSDKAYILEKGIICWEGNSIDLRENPEIMKQYLGV
jgi:branched-chain amino acid transport system ATP-binding protein